METNNLGNYLNKFREETDLNVKFKSFLPIHLSKNKYLNFTNKDGSVNEEFYKWQLLYALINSGKYSVDFVGTEIHFPKGNKTSTHIKFDAAIFNDKNWFTYYLDYHKNKSQKSLDKLRDCLICVIEIKNEHSKNVEIVFNQQLKPAMKESESDYIIGAIYDTGRLYLFKKYGNKYLRLDSTLNKKGLNSGIKDMNLDMPDYYDKFPSFDDVINSKYEETIDRSSRTVNDLQRVTGVFSDQLANNISEILKAMDRQSLVNERGYSILIQMIAMKIFDEKENIKLRKKHLDFYETKHEKEKINMLKFFITDSQKHFMKLSDEDIQEFIRRMKELYESASEKYKYILNENVDETIVWTKREHVILIGEIVQQFQDYSFIMSNKTDLYQLVFYKFASEFSKASKGQFITPIPIIDFLVNIVNPVQNETVIDPTCGIADFLAVSYVKSKSNIDDENLFGTDNDEYMIRLAQLNMLLNGDGNSNLKYKPDKGSLVWKFNSRNDLVELDPKIHKDGNWDNWKDGTKLKKFDVVLTNPPFGQGRKVEPTSRDNDIYEMYHLWNMAKDGSSIDPGLLFLENAVRILKPGGRIGIILSNSLLSIDKWNVARQWLLSEVRIVALFDLPANVFADSGVNTTLLIAYKPIEGLEVLVENDYEVFIKDIKRVGYEVKTANRIKYFDKKYIRNEIDYSIKVDLDGNPIIDEEFSSTVQEFDEWCKTQEHGLKMSFHK